MVVIETHIKKVIVTLMLTILVVGAFSPCYGETAGDLFRVSAATGSEPEATVPEPSPTPILELPDNGELDGEPLYLAVYLNRRQLAEVIEVVEQNGTLYVPLNDIALLVQSAPPENANSLASLEALETIFPAKFSYSEKLQVLFIQGQGRLPVEKKWERDRLHQLLTFNEINEDTPVVEFEYGLLGPPSLDFSARYFKNGEERYNYSFKSAAEALYGTGYIFGRGLENERLTDLRISWERYHPDWFVRVGDVVAPPIQLVAQAEAGRGINFSTFPIENATQFDTETITGDLLEGWEVELYRGNTLLGYRTSDGSGRFTFHDIPLLFGDNDITLKYYGPQGQIQEESRPVNIGRNMAPHGTLWSRFSLIEQGENIFLGRNSQTRTNIKGVRGFGEVFYGLFPKFTLTGSLTSYTSVLQERRNLAKAGYLASTFGSSIKMDFLMDDQGGFGFHSAFLRRIMGWGVQYNHSQFFDLKTDRQPNLKRRDTLKANKSLGQVFMEVSAEQWIDTFDVTRYELRNKVSGSFNRFMLTHDIQANYGGQTEYVRGNLITTGRINPKLLLRAHLNYDVQPETEVRNIRGRLDYKPSPEVTLRMDVIKNMVDAEDYVVSQTVSWEGKNAAVGMTGSYSSTGELMVNASISFSLSPDSKGAYQMRRNPSTGMGTVNVRVFLDHDQDGEYNNEVDELLENVRMEHQRDTSNEFGIVALKGPAYRLTRLKIDEQTLPDPYMVSPPPVAVRPRPSHVNTINIPVWETGEIEGMAEPGERIELIADNKIVATTHAEFDGFFLFEKLRFKIYDVRRNDQSQKVEVHRKRPIARVNWKDRVLLTRK